MIQNIVVTKTGSEASNAARTVFTSDAEWESGGENLVVYKNGSLIIKNTDYTVSSTSQIQLTVAAAISDEISMCVTRLKSATLDTTSLDRVVKKIEGKTQTSIEKNVWEETISSPTIIHSDEIWSSTISEYPANAIAEGVALEHLQLSLIEDTTVGEKKGWYASSNGLITGRLDGWVPPKFGQAYTVRLFDADGIEIPSSAAINWKWDYAAGYLFIENSHSYATPFKINGYKYTGEYGAEGGADGSFWKSPMPTAEDLPTIGNVNGDVRLVLDSNVPYRWDSITKTWKQTVFGSARFKDPVATISELPTIENISGDLRLVLDENGIYRWNATLAQWVSVVTPHNHNNLYYTKLESDAALSLKSDTTHDHNTVYYTQNQIDALVRWRPPVPLFSDLQAYTENRDGDVCMVLENKTIYRFDYFGSPQGLWIPIVGPQLFWMSPVATIADLPVTGTVGEVRLVKGDNNSYWFDGTNWNKITGFVEHNHDELYYRKIDIRWKIPVASKEYLPVLGNEHGDVRITLNDNSIYQWLGLDWELISASPRWRESIDLLIHLPTVGNKDGDLRVCREDSCLYQWNSVESKWVAVFNVNHNHDDRYFTEEELLNGALDGRYYTEDEINAVVKDHKHDGIEASQVSYEDLVDIPYLYWKNPVISVADLPPAGNTIGDARIVLNDAKLYVWNGIAWKNTAGEGIPYHTHDDRYYTELEIDGIINNLEVELASQLALKSDVGHSHNDLYYTKLETEQTIDTRFDIQTGHDHDGVNSKRLSYYALDDVPPFEAHNHDERYYTKENLQLGGESSVNWDNVINKPDLANGHWKSPVQTKDDLPQSGNYLYDLRMVLDESAIYEWSGVEWVFIGFWENRYIDYWKPPVDTYSNLPVLNNVDGDIRLVLDENVLYRWNQEHEEWIVVFSTTYNLQVYLNGDLLMENVEYVRIKEKSIKLKFDVEGGWRLTIVITGDTYTRCDFISYSGQRLFEINNRYKRFDWEAYAGHTIFQLTRATYAIGGSQLLVWLNGDLLKAGDDYTERSTSSFQLSYPTNAEDRVTAIVLEQKSGDGDYLREDQYATAGQKSFILKNYYPIGTKRLLVYYNGLLLKQQDDYSEDNNMSITLVNRIANANDHLTFIIFGSTSGVGVATASDILLGISSDETYQDGLLDLIPEMKLNDAIDDINIALLELAPETASSLEGKVFGTEGLNLHSGYVSAEAGSYEINAGVYHSYLTEDSSFFLFTPDDCFSDADKGILYLYINGNIIDNFNLYNAFVETNADTHQSAASYGLQAYGAHQNEGLQGSMGAIRNSSNGFISIMGVEKFNNFKMWQRGTVRINVTSSILRQGYNYITVVHDTPEGRHTSSPLKIFLDNSNTRPGLEPDIIFRENTLVSEKYLSGVRYYSVGDSFDVSISAFRIFQNTFNQIPMKLSLPGMEQMEIAYNDAAVTGPMNPPRTGDFFDYNNTILLDAFNEYSINAKLHAETFDPFSTGAEGYSGNQNILVNTNISGSTDLVESFKDEQYRLPLGDYLTPPTARTGQWNSEAPLVNGNAIIYDGKLQYPSIDYASYKPAQSVNYSSFSGNQQYIRAFYKRVPRNSGTLTITGPTMQEILLGGCVIDIKLPGQTGWLSLNKRYDVAEFTGADGDGCLLSYTDGTYTYSSGTFSTANSGYMILIRITLGATTSPVTYIEMGGW